MFPLISLSSALSPTCEILIPNLFSAEVFRCVAISLHLLDLKADNEGMQGLKMEVEDLALPLLHQVKGFDKMYLFLKK